jgi:hypothetical protein
MRKLFEERQLRQAVAEVQVAQGVKQATQAERLVSG